MFDLPSWMEFLLLQYCTQSDLEYWQNPMVCHPRHLTWEQLQSTNRHDLRAIKRAIALDRVILDVNYSTLTLNIEKHLYSPFKPNVMTHILNTLLKTPMVSWYNQKVTRWFNCSYIRDLIGYEWFSKNKLLDGFAFQTNALLNDSLELYLMDSPVCSYQMMDLLIRNRAFTILKWVLTNQTIPSGCESLFVRLLQQNAPLDVIEMFPQKPTSLPPLRYSMLQFMTLQYLMRNFTHNETQIKSQLLDDMRTHCTIQYMQWRKIDPIQYKWNFYVLKLKSIELLYDMNPNVLLKQEMMEHRPKKVVFYFTHGITCDVDYLFSIHQDQKLHWQTILLTLYPYSPTMIVTNTRMKWCMANIDLAKWLIDNVVRHVSTTNHLRHAFQVASHHKLLDKVEILIQHLSLDKSLLYSVYDSSVLRVLVNHYGAGPILAIAKQDDMFQLYDFIREVFNTQKPVFDDELMQLLQGDKRLLNALGLFYSWPEEVVELMPKTTENDVLFRLYALRK